MLTINYTIRIIYTYIICIIYHLFLFHIRCMIIHSHLTPPPPHPTSTSLPLHLTSPPPHTTSHPIHLTPPTSTSHHLAPPPPHPTSASIRFRLIPPPPQYGTTSSHLNTVPPHPTASHLTPQYGTTSTRYDFAHNILLS